MMHRRTLLKALAAVAAAFATTAALAQSGWPQRAVTLMVPFAAGGTTDIVARLVGQKL